jgi:hypothetical protein
VHGGAACTVARSPLAKSAQVSSATAQGRLVYVVDDGPDLDRQQGKNNRGLYN